MTKTEVAQEYFNWMCSLVYDERYLKRMSYSRLLAYLHDVDFQYDIPMDGNRAEDGTDLRYRFAYTHDYDYRMIASYLDDRPCSVLEMMVALALRCEEHIMDDPDVGDRTGQWFWTMIISLGLNNMTNARFEASYVDDVLERFFRHAYDRNGKGGLFTIDNPYRDMRELEIWDQLSMYINEIL